MLKYICFDLDGTIGNSLPLCIEAFRRILLRFTGRVFSDPEITLYFGVNEYGLFSRLIPEQADAALDEYCDLYREMHKEWCPAPFAGAVDILKRFRDAGYTLILITGKGRRCCDITLAQYGIADLFVDIFTGAAERLNKADNFRRVMAQYRCAPDEMVYIGDTIGDAQAAAEAGVRCISAAWQPGSDCAALEAVNPGNVCSDLGDLYDRIIGRPAE